MTRFHLTAEQRRLLRAQLCSTEDVDLYRRTLALLEVDQGRSPAEVSRSLGVSCSSVYNWLDIFATLPRPSALVDRRGQGRPSLWADPLQKLLCEALEKTPDSLGYQGESWTVPLLQMHLVRHGEKWLSDPTIRRKLHELGYVWEHSRYVLTGTPEYGKQVPDSAAARAVLAVA